MSTHSSSPARVAANQANAQRSTGPVTDAGKAISSRNAVTTALTGRTVLLTTDDKSLYEQHLTALREHYRPATAVELALVQSIADTEWRLARIPHLIMGFEAKGFAEATADASGQPNKYADLEAYLKYEKQIHNLYLQEGRLHRRREKDIAELRAMQTQRERHYYADLSQALKLYALARQDNQTFDPADHGFEFSIADLDFHLNKQRLALRARQCPAPSAEAA